MRVHESRTIIIFCYFFRSTQIRIIKILCVSRSVMLYAHVKGVSERSELISCSIYTCTLEFLNVYDNCKLFILHPPISCNHITLSFSLFTRLFIYLNCFQVTLVNDSPKVNGNSVTAEFSVSRSANLIECGITGRQRVDCECSCTFLVK